MVEIVLGFVEPARRAGKLNASQKQSSLRRYAQTLLSTVYKHDEKGKVLMGQAANGKQYPLYNELFEKMQLLRNSIGFHYDHENGSKITQDGMGALLALRARSTDFDDCAFICDADSNNMRFPIADKLATASNMRICGVPLDKSLESVEFVALSSYLDHLTSAIVDYQVAVLHDWMERESLVRKTN